MNTIIKKKITNKNFTLEAIIGKYSTKHITCPNGPSMTLSLRHWLSLCLSHLAFLLVLTLVHAFIHTGMLHMCTCSCTHSCTGTHRGNSQHSHMRTFSAVPALCDNSSLSRSDEREHRMVPLRPQALCCAVLQKRKCD